MGYQPAVCYRPDQRPCAVCGEPSDTLWHRRRGALDPHAPGICVTCATGSFMAFIAGMARKPSAEER